MKATLRRLSKMVLAGYGGASLLFFGIGPEFTSPTTNKVAPNKVSEKKSEEDQLEHAIDASEAEAYGDPSESQTAPQPTPSPDSSSYSWWDVLLGKHDQEIFERFADIPVDQQTEQVRFAQETWRKRKAQMKNEAVVGVEHQMPRYWVLTDHQRSQIVLILRGTMSLNELAVDLTCEPTEFEPATTSYGGTGDAESPNASSAHSRMPSHFPFPSGSFRRFPRLSMSSTSYPRYQAHSGMLKMARMMGDIGKPVHLAVKDALHNNPEYELVLSGHSLGAGVAALLGLVCHYNWHVNTHYL